MVLTTPKWEKPGHERSHRVVVARGNGKINYQALKFRRGQHRDRYHLVNVLFEIQKCPKSNVDAVLTFASLQSKQSGSRYQQNRHFFEERLRLSEMQLEEIISTLLLVGSPGRRRLESDELTRRGPVSFSPVLSHVHISMRLR